MVVGVLAVIFSLFYLGLGLSVSRAVLITALRIAPGLHFALSSVWIYGSRIPFCYLFNFASCANFALWGGEVWLIDGWIGSRLSTPCIVGCV
ncbi:hypothetical protein B0I37DRAFT_363555 [Chaetomium sp. MPI-CAGE-AT-0009]|nr:hypothetical protein B0I37DRAFT_363555 [Chaetomium sp. MPI-CAGE-AT-0009]